MIIGPFTVQSCGLVSNQGDLQPVLTFMYLPDCCGLVSNQGDLQLEGLRKVSDSVVDWFQIKVTYNIFISSR